MQLVCGSAADGLFGGGLGGSTLGPRVNNVLKKSPVR